jgi:hypothetical protein
MGGNSPEEQRLRIAKIGMKEILDGAEFKKLLGSE